MTEKGLTALFLLYLHQIKSNMDNKNTIEGPEELFNEMVKDLNSAYFSDKLHDREKMAIVHMMFQNFWMALDSILSEDELEPWGKKLDEIFQMIIEN